MSNVSFETSTCGVFTFAGSGRIDFPRTNFGNQFSLSAWVKPTTASTDIQTLFANAGNGYGSNGFKAFWGYSGITKMVLENGNGGAGSQGLTSNGDVITGEWQHLVYTFNKTSGAVTMYRNGTALSVGGGGMRADAATDQSWWLGAMSGTSYAMNAKIGVVKVYPTVLTSSEVTTDYNSTQARYTATPSCPVPPPANSVLPTVSGTAEYASDLSASTGTWSGSPTYEYQWQSSATSGGAYSDIAFATSATYKPTGEVVGRYLRVNVTATNGGGSVVASSTPTTVISVPNPGGGTPCYQGGLCSVGDLGPGSGVVFYVSNTSFACGPTLAATCKYLEAAREHWNGLVDDYASTTGNYFWDARNPKGTIGANAQGTAIGTGFRNTRAAVAFPLDSPSRAAAVADSYTVTAFGATVNDWYLPAKDELLALYAARNSATLSFPPGGYWSSTETDASQVGEVNFSNGAWNANAATFNYSGVRPIRAFASTLTVPAVPTINSVTAGDRQLIINYTAGSDGGSAITGLFYSLNNETFTSLSGSPHTVSSLLGSFPYAVRIRAQNAIGYSESSTAVTVTTLNTAAEAAAEAERVAAAERAAAAAAETRRQVEEAKKLAEEAKKKADEEARIKAEEEKKKADEEVRIKAEEEKKKLEEEAKKKAEEEKKKLEEEAKKKAEEEKKKLADEAKKKADEDKKKADEEAKLKAEEAKKKEEAKAEVTGSAEIANSPAAAAAAIAGSGEAPNTPIEKTAIKGKYISSALSAGGNKAALKFINLKKGTKIVIKIKRSIR